MAKDEFVKEVVIELKKVQLELPVRIDAYNELKKLLSEQLNDLITNNFSGLISILYRLDISEKKLKGLLCSETNTPAAEIIAEMIVQRQLQKLAARKAFNNRDDNIPEEEKW